MTTPTLATRFARNLNRQLLARLWTLLARGERGRAYNVGSDEGMPLWDVAQRVARVAGTVPPIRARTPIEGAPATVIEAHVDSGRALVRFE